MSRPIRNAIVYIVLFTIPALLVLCLEWLTMGTLGVQSNDGRVYISVAENFLTTGHFVQTVRPVEGMIVPPGTPLMVLLYRLLGLSNTGIMIIQIVLFGVCNILLYETEKRITGRGIWAPIIYTMSYLRCFFRLGLVMVEHYYLLLLCLAVWVLYQDYSKRRKTVILNIVGFAMILFRPVLVPVYLVILVCSLKICWRERKMQPHPYALPVGLILVPILILTVNTTQNYRETGYVIMFENYSASDLYVASREDSPVTLEGAAQFLDDTYRRLDTDKTLNMTERNKLFKSYAIRNIKHHPILFIKNGLLRGHEIFLKAYAWATLYTLAGGIMLAVSEKRKGCNRALIMLLLTLLLAVVSSFGVSELRYSIVIWPVASLHGAFITNHLFGRLKAVTHRKTAQI